MLQQDGIKKEETLLFMLLLTFIGGFSNAYSYATRGGAFVSFQTGNMAKIGLGVYQGDWATVLACALPVLGCLLGAMIAQWVKHGFRNTPELFWQKLVLAAEAAALFAVSFIPSGFHNNPVNFSLSVITAFQLSNFRKYNGAVHNSTIETGNLRTLGGYLGELTIRRDAQTLRKVGKYAALVLSFPLGVILGSLLCGLVGRYAIWVCCALLVVLAFFMLPRLPRAQTAQN